MSATSNPALGLVRAAVSGALTMIPVAAWILFRTYPFNSLDLAGRVTVAGFFLVGYALAGAVIGGVLGFLASSVTGGRNRGWTAGTVPLAMGLAFWITRIRLFLPGGPDVWGVIVAIMVLLLALGVARTLARGRGGRFAGGVAVAQLVAVIWVVATGGSATAPHDPNLQSRLSGLASPAPPRVVVFALDGVEDEILRAMVAAGEVPALSGLIERGAHGRMTTLEPTWSPPIWTTVWTGKLPEEHGITYFVAQGAVRLGGNTVVVPRLLGAHRVASAVLGQVSIPVNQRQRRSTAVWEALGLAGRPSVLANRILSWPALPMRGVELTERLIRVDDAGPHETYPEALAGPTRARLDEAPPVDDPEFTAVPWLAESLAREAELWRVAAEQAIATDADLVILYTHLIDSAQHRFLKYHWPERFRFTPGPDDVETFGEVIRATYRRVDTMVSEALVALGTDARTLVISDHGVRPNLELTEDLGEPEGAVRMPAATGDDVSGVHGSAPDAIFILAGPGVAAGPLGWQPHVLQIAPLLLDLLGLPPALDMVRPSPLVAHPELVTLTPLAPVVSYEGWIPREPAAVGSSADPAILEELRALGYID